MCWHHFLTHVKEGDFNEGKVADLKETEGCTRLESADGACQMDQKNMFEDADPLTLVLSRWELPMKSGGKKETRILQGFWRVGCNI